MNKFSFQNTKKEESIEKNKQKDIIKKIQLARNLYSNIQIWQKLGFKFYSIVDDDILYDAILPEGWSILPSEYQRWSDILDEQNRVRGKMLANQNYPNYQDVTAYWNISVKKNFKTKSKNQ